MINGDDPPPLDAPTSDSPEALVQALRALGKEQPSEAALRATGLRLQARLNAPPITVPAETAVVRVTSTHTLFAGRLIMAALTAAVGVGSFVFLQNRKPASEAPPASAAAPSGGSPPSAATSTPHAPLSSAAPPALQRSAAPTSPGATISASTSRRTMPAHALPAKPVALRRAHERDSKKDPPNAATPPAVLATANVSSETTSPPAQVAAATARVAAPSADAHTATPARPATATELALLLSAQKQAHVDPAAVLRLTAEHARRFPHGVMAPEREVLAIDALRALGRSDEANERLRRFRATYPDSLHTHALTTGTTR